MNTASESPAPDDSGNRQPVTPPINKVLSVKGPSETVQPESQQHESAIWDPAAADDTSPYWVPPGVEIDDWPPELRVEVASIINPLYRELVLLARPGVLQSLGITIVHLQWLEILDQIEIARAKPPDHKSDPLQLIARMSGRESRQQIIERHLRLVHTKLKASALLVRLEEFKYFTHTRKQLERNSDSPNLPTLPPRRPEHGKKDFC